MDGLYDLQTDPFELENLIGTGRGQAVLPGLRAELAKLAAGDTRQIELG